MGGRGSTSKILSNIDAKRYEGDRAIRAKEIEASRAAAVKPARAPRVASKIIEKPGMVSALVRTGTIPGTIRDQTARKDLPSLARSKDGILHVTKQDKNSFTVTDHSSGFVVRSFGTKKGAMQFLNASTRKDGTASPTVKRAIAFMRANKEDIRGQSKAKSGSAAFQAVMRVGSRIRERE